MKDGENNGMKLKAQVTKTESSSDAENSITG